MEKDEVQVQGRLPRSLKRELYAALALQEKKFTPWLREQAETWVATVASTPRGQGETHALHS